MNFNSWQFLVFFPVIWGLYLLFASRLRHNGLTQALLLASSLFFYACWNPVYLILMLFSIAVTWATGMLMEGKTPPRKKLVLAASLVLNLAVLFFFKYYNFCASMVNSLFVGSTPRLLPAFNVLLPVGISFYTFQALGYSIDVYRGTVQAERNFVSYALFVSFFPQLVAGPIERTANLLPQFKTDYRFDYDRVTSGLRLAAWGMFKKIVISDRVAVYVNAVYGSPGVYPASTLALATFLFAFQIYCDFSGYSDIAIGTARILGFRLMVNFRQPYFSASISEFWRRWHISLSTWLKDYVYIPLGGNRKGALRRNINLIITFFLSGLWHGAAWRFVVWGLLHGIFQVVERFLGLSDRVAGKITTLRRVATFLVVCLAWVFFRAANLSDAFFILKKFSSLPAELAGYVRQLPQTGLLTTVRNAFQLGVNVAHPIAGFGITGLGLSFIGIAVLLIADFRMGRTAASGRIALLPPGLRWAGYYAIVMAIILSIPAESSQFIYFTF
jgi:D-alanyl-lipoteichoic acid acyltransferase DltB (MBOAT superfamily)